MKKKVLFLIDTLNVGGAEKSLLDILPRLTRYEALICHIYPGETLKRDFESRGVRVYSMGVPLPYNLSIAIRAVEGLCRELKPDLIHSSLFKADIVSRSVGKKLGIPLINSLVNNAYHPSRFQKGSLQMKIKLKVVQWADAWTARKVDLFISNSQAIKDSNSRALNLPTSKVKVIYRGRDASAFAPISDVEQQRLENEFKLRGKTVILNVSRLLERKGQLDLLRAFSTLAERFPQAVLLIAGDGTFRQVLEDEVTRLNVGGIVHLLGSRKDVPALLRIAHAFVFPSYYEGLPGALIEAMMSEVPIVASAIPENLECVDNTCAELFQPGNVPEMAQAMAKVLEKSDPAKVNRAKEIALSKFDIQSICAQYEAAYDALLRQ